MTQPTASLVLTARELQYLTEAIRFAQLNPSFEPSVVEDENGVEFDDDLLDKVHDALDECIDSQS